MHKIFAVVFATKRLQNTGFLMYSAMCPCARTLPTVRVQALKHDVSLSRHAEAGAQAGATARLATQAAAAVHNPERGRSALALLAQMTAVPNWLCRPGLQRQSPPRQIRQIWHPVRLLQWHAVPRQGSRPAKEAARAML